LQLVGRVAALDGCREQRGRMMGESLAWGSGGIGGTILLLLRLLVLLRSIYRYRQRRRQSVEHIRGCTGYVGWCAGAKFRARVTFSKNGDKHSDLRREAATI
jgi:hypothetical protein